MDQDLKFRWIEVISSEKSRLGDEKGRLDYKFWALVGFATGIVVYLGILSKKAILSGGVYLSTKTVVSFFLLVLAYFWIDAARRISRFYEEHVNEIKNELYFCARKYHDLLIYSGAALIQGAVFHYFIHSKINAGGLITSLALSILLAIWQFLVMLLPVCRKWWYMREAKRVWIMKYKNWLNCFLILYCLSTAAMFATMFDYCCSIWGIDYLSIIWIFLIFIFSLAVLLEILETKIKSDHLPNLDELYLNVISGSFKSEHELKQAFLKIMDNQ